MKVKTALRGTVDCTGSPQVKLTHVQMECVKTLNGYINGHTGWVHALAPLGDGTLASGSFDYTVKVWDLQSGSCLQTLEGHTNSARALASLADGTLESGSVYGSIKLWQ
ncbi:MAG: WD40 repeat domain-containing protein [Parachlamydiaceae bacterium]